MLVNGHGSNSPLVDLVARKTVLATESLCMAVNYFSLAMDDFNKVRETEVIAHADEFETSLYLHLAPERAKMDMAVVGNDIAGEYMSSDSTSNYPVRFNDFWGRWTKSGVHGDPTKAKAEKGKIIFESAISGLINIVKELRDWKIEDRSDQHTQTTQSNIRW